MSRAFPFQGVDAGAHGGLDLGVHARHEVLARHPEFQSRHAATQRGAVIRHRGIGGRRVARVVAGDGLQKQGGVMHVLRQRANLVERGGERHQAETRHAAVCRLQADDTGHGRRLADGAAGV